MKKQLAAALLLACAPFAASARDSLGSFTYVEGGFQRLSVDFGTPGSDSLDFNGVGIRASKELSDNFYIYGGYAWSKNSDLDTSIYARQMQAGFGYRYTVFDNADLTADVGFQHAKLDGAGSNDNTLDAARVSVGLRGALGNNFEGWLKANYVDGSDYDSEFSGTLGAQFIINETWGVVGEVEAGDLTSQYMLGIRASF
jgi:Outer membrane protein beta-barrel domain